MKNILITLLLSTTAVLAAPRSPLPPYPESTLFLERFDTTNQFFNSPTLATASKQVDSWSGYAENITSGSVFWASAKVPNPYVTAQGTIRFWVAPNWTSGSRAYKTPGTLAEVCSWIGKQAYPQISIQVTPDGNAIGVTENGQIVLGAKIAWTNSSWHQVAITYVADASVLYIDGQAVSKGSGLVVANTQGTTGFCLGSDDTGKNQADAAYDEVTTLYYPATAADISRVYLFAASLAALGPVTAAELAAEQATRTARLASRQLMSANLLSSPLGAQPMGLSYSDLTTGSFRLIQTAFYFTNSTSISNISLVTIASDQTNLSYDVFRTRMLVSPITNGQWVWVGRGQPGTTLTITNEPMDMAFYIGATTNDTDGDGVTDAYEALVTHTSPTSPPIVQINTPTNSTILAAPTDINISISASNYITPITITLFTNGTQAASQYTYYGTGTFTLPDVTAGTYALSASIVDGAGERATSSVVNVTVTLPQVANIVCWLKADALSLANATTVTNWLDSSGHTNNATNTLANAPMLLTNQINGLPAVKFNGTNTFLALSGFLTNQAEVFIVVKPDGTNSGSLWYFSTNQQATVYNPTNITDNFGRATLITVGNNSTNFNIYNITTQPGQWIGRINGGVGAQDVPTNAVFGTTYYLGRSANGAGWTNGKPWVAEIIVYNQVQTEAGRVAVGRYLNSKYGLSVASPAAPTLACQAPVPRSIKVSWNAITNASYYTLSRQIDTGAATVIYTGNSKGTNFTDIVDSLLPITYTLTTANYKGNSSSTLTTPLMVFTSPANEAVVPINQAMNLVLSPYQSGIPGMGGYTFVPTKVETYVNEALVLTQTNAPWGFVTTNYIPTRYNIQTRAFDTSGNSRFTAVLGINVTTDIDSDGDDVPDSLDWWPYDPTQWNQSPNPGYTNAPVIILTEPPQ